MNSILRRLITIFAVLGTLVVNTLANALPLNGQNTGEISDRFEILFVPAGYVFSIWGLIYLFLLGYTVYQALPSQKDNPYLIKISPWVWLSCAANIVWIFLWHYNLFGLTWVAMLILLGSLIRVFMLLEIGRRAASSTEKLLVHLTFSIYLGWITVATIANLTQVLYFLKWDGFGINDTAWAFVLLAAAVAIGAWMAFSRGVPAYLAVLVWAVVGVGVRNAANPALMIGSYAAALILAALMVKAFFPTRKTA